MNRRAISIALAGAFVLLAAVETGASLTASARVASPADWQAAAAEVRAGLQAGDLIVFAPYWADQNGRSYLGDVMPVDMVARADADRYARVWELSIRGARAPETLGDGVTLEQTSQHGKVRVALYHKPAAAVAWDSTAAADEARVTMTPLDRNAPDVTCVRDNFVPGFRCPGGRVEKRTLEIDYRPRRGLLVPVEPRQRVHVAWSEATLGKSLVVYAGLHDYYARKNNDQPVELRLYIDGRQQFDVHVANDKGWQRFDVDTAALAGTRHELRFDAEAGNATWRNLGLHAEARR